jgi:hypothetical protein
MYYVLIVTGVLDVPLSYLPHSELAVECSRDLNATYRVNTQTALKQVQREVEPTFVII